MAIIVTRTNFQTNENTETRSWEGRVIEIRRSRATRNVSDTLDYSDYQTVDVVEALVYNEKGIDLKDRFIWIDCSNLFVWRGADHNRPEVDADALNDPKIAADHVAWQAEIKAVAEARAAATLRYQEEEKKRQLEFEHNRPVKGKKMIVFKGRKVPVGTIGVVAYVHDNGGILLKDEANWQDRKAPGVWVNAGNLKAV